MLKKAYICKIFWKKLVDLLVRYAICLLTVLDILVNICRSQSYSYCKLYMS